MAATITDEYLLHTFSFYITYEIIFNAWSNNKLEKFI